MPIQPKNQQGRNEPCSCQSGLKFKFCHGDPSKQVICSRVANLKMTELILVEQKKKGLIPYSWNCNNCNHGFDKPKHGRVSNLPLCPKCESVDIIERVEDEGEEENANKNR